MPKYVYPAVFTPEQNGLFSVNFPDVSGCYTSGESLVDAMEMAEDVLAMMLCFMEQKGESIPSATPIKNIITSGDSFSTLIICDTTNYPLLECESDEQ